MLAALLERLGVGRREPLGRVLLRAGVISEEGHPLNRARAGD